MVDELHLNKAVAKKIKFETKTRKCPIAEMHGVTING